MRQEKEVWQNLSDFKISIEESLALANRSLDSLDRTVSQLARTNPGDENLHNLLITCLSSTIESVRSIGSSHLITLRPEEHKKETISSFPELGENLASIVLDDSSEMVLRKEAFRVIVQRRTFYVLGNENDPINIGEEFFRKVLATKNRQFQDIFDSELIYVRNMKTREELAELGIDYLGHF